MIDLNDVKLAPSDQQALSLLAQGRSNKKTASFLNTSPRNVKQFLRTLFMGLLIATKTAPVAGLTAERHETEEPQPSAAPEHNAIGFGLPCSHCHAYYPADMLACPPCKSPEHGKTILPFSIAAEVPPPSATEPGSFA